MSEINSDLQKHLEYNCYLKNTFSIDQSKVNLLQNDTKEIYNINLALFIIYYLILFTYIILDYNNILFGKQIISHIFFIIFLLAYPFIIFAIQYNTYEIFSKSYQYVFQNIYKSKDY